MNVKLLLIAFSFLFLYTCNDRFYDGSDRYIVQGVVMRDGEIQQHKLVRINTYLEEEWKPSHDTLKDPIYDQSTIANSTYTDKSGAFKMSFPKGKYIYVLEIDQYRKTLINGLTADARELLNVGTIDISRDTKK